MAECSDNISYLKRWPEDKYEPFPILNEEKMERYNMDENQLEDNQVQVDVVGIDGLDSEAILNIYIASVNPKYEKEVTNNQSNIRVVSKLG